MQKKKAKKQERTNRKYLIGIDEVGRGPLAGPVAVGAVLATPRILRQFKTIKESKQLSEAKREEWSARIIAMANAHPDELRIAVAMVSARAIDTRGISTTIRRALANALKRINPDPNVCEVLLDGGLKAPEIYKRQRTIIRGDASETVIAMASVIAKVKRDQYMVQLAKRHPGYEFERHKGYGTKAHIAAIFKLGLSREHRESFCRFYKPK